MTDLEEFLEDLGEDAQLVDIALQDLKPGDVFDMVVDIHLHGQHLIVAPSIVPGDLTFDIALFGADGRMMRRRLMSIMSEDLPFVLGGDPSS